MRTDVRLPSRAGCHSGSPQSGESGGTISPLLFVFFFFFFMGEPEVAWAALEPGAMPNSRRLALVSAAARGVGG